MINFQIGKPVEKNACYLDDKLARDFYDLSYVGGYKYRNGLDCEGDPVFQPHENESPKSVKRRKSLTNYDNYCAMVIDRYNNFIFVNSIRRDNSPEFLAWSEDVDLNGTNLQEFMKYAIKKAQIHGKSYIQIESTKTEAEDGQTVAQSEAVGNRLFLIDVHPDNIVNWTCAGNVYKEIVVSYPEESKYCLYTDDSYQECWIDETGNITHVSELYSHDFERLPFIVCIALDHGMSQLRDIAELNKINFNLNSWLMEELSKHTFTQSFIMGWKPKTNDAKDNYTTISFGSRKYICLNHDTDSTLLPTLDKVGADISQAESLSNAIEKSIDGIYRQAGLSDLSHDSMGQRSSGNSLRIKLNDMTLMAAGISHSAEKAENSIIDFLNYFSNGIQFEYSDYPDNDELDIEAFGDELKTTLDVIASPDMPKTLKNEQLRSFAKVAYPRLDTPTLVELEEELTVGPPNSEPEPINEDLKNEGIN